MATISSLLADHVTLRVRSVDRLFLQGYVPRLMTQGQVIRFLLDRGFPIPSPALLGKIGRGYVQAIDRFRLEHDVPIVHFKKGDVKEEIAREYFKRAERDGRFGVVLIGVVQERTSAWRGWRDGGPDGHPHFEYRRQSIFPNNYYFYIRDPQWGPAFIKTIAYAPWPVWVYLNGHEWAKRQAATQGIDFAALDNGFAACDDADALAVICGRLSAGDVHAFFDRWQARLPSPFTAQDRARGYGYDLAFRQLEISDTRVFDRSAAGRAWFERTLPDQLTLGRPDQIAVVFARRVTRSTPGRFHTKVITRGVEPSIQVHYRASKVKQYFKEGRALRTETTVNDTRDFGIGRRVTSENWDALLQIGHQINQRLLTARRPDKPQSPRAHRRADPRLRAAADDLRPAAPTPQRVHPANPPHPPLRADQRGIPTGRLLHQDLHADRQPVPRRTRSHPPQRDRHPLTTRQLLARLRTPTRRPHRRRCPHSLKMTRP